VNNFIKNTFTDQRTTALRWAAEWSQRDHCHQGQCQTAFVLINHRLPLTRPADSGKKRLEDPALDSLRKAGSCEYLILLMRLVDRRRPIQESPR
jgi:hypothetical protein